MRAYVAKGWNDDRSGFADVLTQNVRTRVHKVFDFKERVSWSAVNKVLHSVNKVLIIKFVYDLENVSELSIPPLHKPYPSFPWSGHTVKEREKTLATQAMAQRTLQLTRVERIKMEVNGLYLRSQRLKERWLREIQWRNGLCNSRALDATLYRKVQIHGRKERRISGTRILKFKFALKDFGKRLR